MWKVLRLAYNEFAPRRSRNAITLLIVTLGWLTSVPAHGASHTWSGAVNGLFSNPGNWSAGGVPTLSETNVLVFPSGATRKTVTNDIGALKVASFNLAGGYTVRGASPFNVMPNLVNILCNGSNVIESPLTFSNLVYISVGTDDSLVLSGQLTGTGSLYKGGDGGLFLRGTANNTFSGGLDVQFGSVTLGKTGGAVALPGPVNLGGTDTANLTFLYLEGSEQISGAANVTINRAAGLFMNGHTNTVNSVTISAGAIQTYTGLSPSPGLLRINSGMNLAAWLQEFPLPDVSPIIRGQLEFIGASCSLFVSNANVQCDIEADINEYGGVTVLNKTGPGTLALKGGGNFTGALNINEGRVIAYTSSSLGTSAAGTTVANGCTLELRDGVNMAEALSLTGMGTDGRGALQLLSGTVTLSGLITLNSQTGVDVRTAGSQMNINSPIGGSGGLRKLGAGELRLNGFGHNSFSGASFVDGGRLTLNKSAGVRAVGSVTVANGATLASLANEQIDDAGVLSLYSGAGVNFTNRNETISGLNIGPATTLDTGAGLLTLLGNVYSGRPYDTNVSIPAVIRGSLSLGGATRSITTSNYGQVMFDCTISDGDGVGGLHLTSGSMYLMRSNSFSGTVTVGGSCFVSNAWAFGTSGGGVILAGQSNTVNSVFLMGATAIASETLFVHPGSFSYLEPGGTNAWNGRIIMTNNASLHFYGYPSSDMTLGGSISGTNELFTFTYGTSRMLGTNTYTGRTLVLAGTLVLQDSQALGSTNSGTELEEHSTLRMELSNGAHVSGEALTVKSDEFVDYTNASVVVVGAVSNMWSGPITIGGDPSRVEVQHSVGVLNLAVGISGTGALEKTGAGTLVLSGASANTYAGDTVVERGALWLAKANGVQAVSNLSIKLPASLKWRGSEQIADSATLSLKGLAYTDVTNAVLAPHSETLTHLNLKNSFLDAGGGGLTLLGDIDLSDPTDSESRNIIWGTLRLGPGTHSIVSTVTNLSGLRTSSLLVPDSIHETGGTAGINVRLCDIGLHGSNSFSGVLKVDNGWVDVRHAHAFGSPAEGVFLTNSSWLSLSTPDGTTFNEALVIAPLRAGFIYPSIIYGPAFATNTWVGPVTLLGENQFNVSFFSKLIFAGPVHGPSAIQFDGSGELELTGPNVNTVSGLIVNRGRVRLSKTAGAVAFSGPAVLDGNELDKDLFPKVILEAPGQFPATSIVTLGLANTNALLDLNGHAAAIGALKGLGTLNIRSGTLTISNGVEYGSFQGKVFAQPGGTRLIKRGPISQGMTGPGEFHGDVFVEQATLQLGENVIGALHLAAGTTVDLYGASQWGSLAGAGNIDSSSRPIRVGHNNASTLFSGIIFGGGQTNLIKVGTGTLTLSGANAFPGATFVQDGALIVNGSLPGPVRVQPGGAGQQPLLGGIGTLGNVVVTGTGARIAPGATAAIPSYGKLTVTNFALDAGALYVCEIGGTNAGVNLDRIEARETFTLLAGAADFKAFGAGSLSNRYVVAKSFASVNGTFVGDPEGDMISPAAGRSMLITYLTASGREITLIEQPGANLGNLQMGGISVGANGHMTISGTGVSGALYAVLANTNLNTTNWIVIGTTAGNINGALNFTDTNAPLFPSRFYQFVLPGN
jgi:fibronectin-binding autotransporter adhesin